MGTPDLFSRATREWFGAAFPGPTRIQELAWPVIARSEHALLVAPTGSGKTLAAFLWCIDRIAGETMAGKPVGNAGRQRPGVSALYISPLKALSYDIERNLKAPLVGIGEAAQRLALPDPNVSVAVRTGDTPADARRDIVRRPPDILITTPESLYLLLTSQARAVLRSVRWVIVDEVHSLAGNKRGAHLALSLERLERLVGGGDGGRPSFQRLGLSATVRPVDEVACFLGGVGREVTVVDAGGRKRLDLEVVVPAEEMAPRGRLAAGYGASPEARSSIWPAIYPRLLDLVLGHHSTIIFVNSRRLAERVALRLNELHREQEADVGADLVRAHHGSIAREQRLAIEDALKAGRLRGLVATSSLELGIDMGAVDLVVQVESPKSVTRGIQRIGRAGHSVDAVAVGKIVPKYRGDLVEAAVVARLMQDGEIEPLRPPRNPLDVLAQQIEDMCAMDSWSPDELFATVRRADAFARLPRELFDDVLELLSGLYPSDEFAELRPRLVWDRAAGTIVARRDAHRIAVTSGGTIPDRGLYGVHLGIDGPRVGELDEEMVYESRAGETFFLGASTWRIEQITPNRVIVSPAPGEAGKVPFWHGDAAGRSVEVGRAVGAFIRELTSLPEAGALDLLRVRHNLDEFAARNLLAYLAEQRDATGALPTDTTMVVERFRDELGDWRVSLLTPFGARVHAPLSLAIEERLRRRMGLEVQTIWSDDGVAIRLPETESPPADADLLPETEELEELLTSRLPGTALFAARFRENAARALLLPRRRGNLRTPLWQMRQRAADLLAVASRYGSFPMVLETFRECLQDVFDVPGLLAVLRGIASRQIQVVSVETSSASPFSSSLIFGYIAEFMYEGDAPLAERRAQALTLDRDLLRELLGQEELRELLDPAALTDLELELQRLAGARRATNADQLHDLLRRLGDLSMEELGVRSNLFPPDGDRRFQRLRIAGEERYVAIEDVARYRDALGAVPPPGIPEVYLAPARDALASLLARYARTHGPFTADEPARRWGLAERRVQGTLERLVEQGRLVYGEFRPGGHEREWCDPEVLRSLRRRSLARLRKAVEPVSTHAFARFLPGWQGVGTGRQLVDVLNQLQGAAIPASVLESEVLPARIDGYRPREVDDLCLSGEFVWVGRGALGRDDGRLAFYRRDHPALIPRPADSPEDELQRQILQALDARGASFYRDIYAAVGGGRDEPIVEALWALVWAGYVTNDSLAPLRALRLRRPKAGSRRPPVLTRGGPPEAAGRWSLVASLVAAASAEEASLATARMLLERYGIVTREAAAGEGIAGGFSAIYPVLRMMEEAGKVRRGYFVEGLGGAQFGLPGAVERLRAEREAPDTPRALCLSAVDPANPFGMALPWGGRRIAGARVVIVDGQPVLYLERGGSSLLTFPPFDDPEVAEPALSTLGHVTIERINGEPALKSPHAGLLLSLGFVRDYLALAGSARLAGATRAGG